MLIVFMNNQKNFLSAAWQKMGATSFIFIKNCCTFIKELVFEKSNLVLIINFF